MLDGAGNKPVIQSVSRAISILRCFDGDVQLSLSEIARMVGLHKSTTAGIISTLRAEGFLEHDENTGKLRLGLALFSLAVQARRGLAEICEPYLNMLLNLTGETVNLAVLDKTEIVYIAKKESPQSVRISSSVGAHRPVYCTAVGKALLASMCRQEAEALLAKVDIKPLTQHTIIDKKELFKAIDTARQDGVAYDFEEFQLGLICVGAPLFQKEGNPVGAISVSGPSLRINDEVRCEISKIVKEIAGQICKELTRLL